MDDNNKQIGTNFRMDNPEDAALYNWMKLKLEKTAYIRSLMALAQKAEKILGVDWEHEMHIWLKTCEQK